MRWSIRKTFLLIALFFLTSILALSLGKNYPKNELSYGLTFSKKRAGDLGFGWKKVYSSILNELEVKRLRLPAYWDEIEPDSGKLAWNDMDWQINEAGKKNVQIILAVGGRLPRWPECHFPSWAENLSENQRQDALLKYIEETVKRYKNNPNIIYWQVENEPFLNHFGECPPANSVSLDKEIALVRSLDDRPIVVTDSGELSLWVPAASRADIFGTTMYRDTYSKALGLYVHYPILPGFFHFKKNLTSLFAHPKKWVVIELQAEPWGPQPFEKLSQTDRNRTMSLGKLKDIIDFSSKTGFSEFYLWGAEWWYWEKEANHNPELWEYAKQLFTK